MEVDIKCFVVDVLEVDLVDGYGMEDGLSVEDVLRVEEDLRVEDVLSVEDAFEEFAVELTVELVVDLKS